VAAAIEVSAELGLMAVGAHGGGDTVAASTYLDLKVPNGDF
jgi:hypothetical protein